MKFAAWCACWPLLGVMWFCCTLGDCMTDVCEGLYGVVETLNDFIDGEDV